MKLLGLVLAALVDAQWAQRSQELQRMIEPDTKLETGTYRHYKGGLYSLLGVARHSETGELLVVYRPQYGEAELWVRPLTMFTELVEQDGKRQPRFAWVAAPATEL